MCSASQINHVCWHVNSPSANVCIVPWVLFTLTYLCVMRYLYFFAHYLKTQKLPNGCVIIIGTMFWSLGRFRFSPHVEIVCLLVFFGVLLFDSIWLKKWPLCFTWEPICWILIMDKAASGCWQTTELGANPQWSRSISHTQPVESKDPTCKCWMSWWQVTVQQMVIMRHSKDL